VRVAGRRGFFRVLPDFPRGEVGCKPRPAGLTRGTLVRQARLTQVPAGSVGETESLRGRAYAARNRVLRRRVDVAVKKKKRRPPPPARRVSVRDGRRYPKVRCFRYRG